MAAARFDELAIGGAVADDPILSYPLSADEPDPLGSSIDTANRGVIGTAILKDFVVTLNYDLAKIALRPLNGKDESAFEWCGPGITVLIDAGNVVVRSVYKDGPAEGKIQAGDRILEIDGRPVQGLELDKIVQMLRGEPGTNVEMEIENEHGAKTVKLARRKLL
jgi:C-terminal processing protease CtpA/Prc